MSDPNTIVTPAPLANIPEVKPQNVFMQAVAGIKSLILSAIAWEQANPRKVMAIVLYIGTHSTHLKPLMDFASMVLGMPVG